MDKGMIDRTLLENNIKQINFYQEEEKKILERIYKTLKESTKDYQSTSTTFFLHEIKASKKNIHLIYQKRTKYQEVLTKVISSYQTLGRKTNQIFTEK